MNIKKEKLVGAILASLVGVSGAAIAQERVEVYEKERVHEESTMDNIRDSVSDTATVAKVNAKFATSSVVDALDINVDAENGTIFLRGQVANASERNEAVRLAREIDEVKRVDTSDLIIDPNH